MIFMSVDQTDENHGTHTINFRRECVFNESRMFRFILGCWPRRQRTNEVVFATVELDAEYFTIDGTHRFRYEELESWGVCPNGNLCLNLRKEGPGVSFELHTPDSYDLYYKIGVSIARRMHDIGTGSYVENLETIRAQTNGLMFVPHRPMPRSECAICLESLDVCVQLQCGHVFHETCARQWHMRGKKECCLCRTFTGTIDN